jgi:hypothetical protein
MGLILPLLLGTHLFTAYLITGELQPICRQKNHSLFVTKKITAYLTEKGIC